jgi:diguanylate cyclase (GGDEF)-like protein/PAS domain S-box-containing protein
MLGMRSALSIADEAVDPRTTPPSRLQPWVIGALAAVALTIGVALTVPNHDYVVPWVPGLQNAASFVTLLVVGTLGAVDALRSRSGRALPIAAAAAFLVPLIGGRLLTAPGVLPPPLPLPNPATTSLFFSLTNITFPIALSVALLIRPGPLARPRGAVAVAVASFGLLGGALALSAFVLAPHLPPTNVGGHFTAFSNALNLVALLPGVALGLMFIRGHRGDLRVSPSIAAAVVLLGAQELLFFGVGHRYEPSWYAEAVLSFLPIVALALGQISLLHRAAVGELMIRRSLTEVVECQRLLHEAVSRLATSLDVDTLVRIAATGAGLVIRGPHTRSVRATVFRIDDAVLRREAVYDTETNTVHASSMPLPAHPLIAQVVATGRSVVGVLGADAVGAELREVIAKAGVTGGVWVPLYVEEKIWGVLAVHARGVDDLDAARVSFLESLASATGLALSNARRFEQERLLSEQSADMICRLTPDGRYTYVSAACRTMLGYEPAELVGRTPSELMASVELDDHADALASAGSMWNQTVQARRFHRKDGTLVWLESTATAVRDSSGAFVELICVARDITARKRQEEELVDSLAEVRASRRRLADIAATDHLTGLTNRREFERLADPPQPGPFAVLAVDVDNLKFVNDAYGHEAGDEVIRAVGRTLDAALRRDDVVARTGGDEFAVLLPDTGESDALVLGDRIRLAMHGVVVPRGQVRISVGCASGSAADPVARVWATADQALLTAKREGRDRLGSLVGADSGQNPVARWESAAPKLLAPGAIRSVYQPIVDLGNGEIVGFEALARPAHAGDGDDVHSLFAAAERLGLTRDLDWACRRAALHDGHQLPEGHPVFVNVASASFLDPVHGADQMALLARWARRRASDVVIELCDRDHVRDLDRLRAVVADYRALGFRLALDNVGDGRATLQVLEAMQPDFVKLSSRISRAAGDPGSDAVIAALVVYASRTRALLIAQGVETSEQARLLADRGIQLGQGYALGRPAAPGTWQVQGPDVAAHG